MKGKEGEKEEDATSRSLRTTFTGAESKDRRQGVQMDAEALAGIRDDCGNLLRAVVPDSSDLRHCGRREMIKRIIALMIFLIGITVITRWIMKQALILAILPLLVMAGIAMEGW